MLIVGLFYEARRKYLNDENPLQSPDEFQRQVGKDVRDTREDIVLRTIPRNVRCDVQRRGPESVNNNKLSQRLESPPMKTEKFYLQISNKNWEEKEAAAVLKAQYRRQEAIRRSKLPNQRKIFLQVNVVERLYLICLLS